MRRSQSFYLPQLDGLRFFAFLAVFVWHFWSGWTLNFIENPAHSPLAKIGVHGLSLGAAGVDLFFALSGYLITELLLRERRQHGVVNVRSFYLRRALRIWPIYYGFLIATLIATFALRLPALLEVRAWLPWFFLMVGNFALGCGAPLTFLAPLWSVSVEEQFYLFWPLVMRPLSRRRMVQVAASIWATAIIFRMVTRIGPNSPLAFDTFARLDPIAMGALLAAILDGRTRINSRLRASSFAAGGAALFALAFLLGLLDSARFPDLIYLPALSETMLALGSGGFLLAAIVAGTGSALARAPFVYLGRISYGLYVFHAAVMGIGAAMFGKPEGWADLTLMTADLLATIALAAASYRWFERPFLKLKGRFQQVSSGAPLQPDTVAASAQHLRLRVAEISGEVGDLR